MVRMRGVGLVWALAGALVALVGCGDEAAEPASEQEQAALEGRIGPGGGTLADDALPGFEGFALEVPAGALEAEVEITVRLGLDPTPLEDDTTFCGAGFIIEADAALAAPVTVTLPVDGAMVTQAGQAPGDVSVWALDGQGWESVEATDADEGSVTIALDRFTTVAPGLTFKRLPRLCNIDPDTGACVTATTTEPTPEPSCPAGRFCVSVLPRPAILPLGGFNPIFVRQDKVHYLGGSPEGFRVVTLNTKTGGVSPSAPFSGVAVLPRNFVVDQFGQTWFGGFSLHNFQVPQGGGAVTIFDFDATGLGAVFMDGPLVRLSSLGAAFREPVSSTAPFGARVLPQNTNQLLSFNAVFEPVSGDLLMPQTTTSIARFQMASGVMNRLDDATRTLPDGQSLTIHAPLAASEGDAPLVAAISSTGALVVFAGDAAPQVIAGLPPLMDLAFDAEGNLWVAMLQTPEVGFIRAVADPGNRSLNLVSIQAEGDAASRLPQRLGVMPDGRLVVRTSGRDFIIVEFGQ